MQIKIYQMQVQLTHTHMKHGYITTTQKVAQNDWG